MVTFLKFLMGGSGDLLSLTKSPLTAVFQVIFVEVAGVEPQRVNFFYPKINLDIP